MIDLVIRILSTITLSMIFVAFMCRVSNHLALVDKPGGRKQHTGVVPLCGGLCVFTAFAAIVFYNGDQGAVGVAVWLSLAIVVAVGMIDDIVALPELPRFFLQLFVAGLLVSSLSIATLSFGSLLPSDALASQPLGGLAMLIFGIVFITGLTNAWNMSDGVDGLAGGTAAIALLWLALFAAARSDTAIILPIQTLLAATFGFLAFNLRSRWRKRASVFLGDAGSTAFGAMIGYLVIRLATGDAALPFFVLLWVVIVPIMDTLSLMARRLYAGRSPMSADRWHLHHLLMNLGFTPAQTTNCVMAATAVCGAVGYIGYRMEIPDPLMAAGLLLPVLAHAIFVWIASGASLTTELVPIKTAEQGDTAPFAVTSGVSITQAEPPPEMQDFRTELARMWPMLDDEHDRSPALSEIAVPAGSRPEDPKGLLSGMRWRSVCLFVAGSLAVSAATYGVALASADAVLSVRDPVEEVDMIVVLGGDGPPRAKQAAKLWKAGVARQIFVTGKGDCEDIRTWMIEEGVTPTAIFLECFSSSTWENATFSVPKLRQLAVRRAVLVTSWFHSKRAIACFRAFMPETTWLSSPAEHSLGFWGRLFDIEGVQVFKEYPKTLWYDVRLLGVPTGSNSSAQLLEAPSLYRYDDPLRSDSPLQIEVPAEWQISVRQRIRSARMLSRYEDPDFAGSQPIPRFGGPTFSLKFRLMRLLWMTAWLVLARWTPPPLRSWRNAVLRLFGAKLHSSASVHSKAVVWWPGNLVMGRFASIGPGALCYNIATVTFGDFASVSQRAHLCTGTHNVQQSGFELIARPIDLGKNSWVAAEAFVGPGVIVGEGAVLAARGVTVKSLQPWTIYAGNSARPVGARNQAGAALHVSV
ncbi:ElyC/SanA/YdcF family protein [Rhizobium sp. Leaf391]|uniref:ElyC/SanA/YdcF family protein n=2 Tax=Rhizobium TaxID=379 RepID=UPI001FCD9FC5|nr:ElyC/SanA/YdcF family protein [Rhizobium sp. Leaf391]